MQVNEILRGEKRRYIYAMFNLIAAQPSVILSRRVQNFSDLVLPISNQFFLELQQKNFTLSND